jgi:putative oxidoreductase
MPADRIDFHSERDRMKRSSLQNWATFPLRLIVGFGFLQHGFAKLTHGVGAFAEILHALAVPAPHLMALVTIGVELTGGICVLLGLFVPLVSLPMAVVLLVAMISVHLPYGFSSIKLTGIVNGRAQFGPPGYECDLLYLACLLALVLAGPSPFSIDRRLREPSLDR